MAPPRFRLVRTPPLCGQAALDDMAASVNLPSIHKIQNYPSYYSGSDIGYLTLVKDLAQR